MEVRSDVGCLHVELVLDDSVPPGVALIPKGRWPSRQLQGANVNVLTTAPPADMGRSSAIHGTEVTIRSTAT